MSNLFNLQRFLQLFKKHLAEHIKLYLLSMVLMFGVSLLLLEYIIYIHHRDLRPFLQANSFIVIFLFAGSIFTSLSFSSLSSPRQAISALTLPASTFEKYLLQWILSFVIFQLVAVGIFYLADAIVITLNPSATYEGVTIKNVLFSLFDSSNQAYYAFIFYFLFHSLTFWGAIFFDKLHFVKTVFLFFVVLILLKIMDQTFLSSFIHQSVYYGALPYSTINFYYQGRNIYIDPPAGILTLRVVVLLCITTLLWTSAFFRLKEKQI